MFSEVSRSKLCLDLADASEKGGYRHSIRSYVYEYLKQEQKTWGKRRGQLARAEEVGEKDSPHILVLQALVSQSEETMEQLEKAYSGSQKDAPSEVTARHLRDAGNVRLAAKGPESESTEDMLKSSENAEPKLENKDSKESAE